MGVTVSTDGALTPVTTSSGVWTASITGTVSRSLTFHFDEDIAAVAATVELRDDQIWDGASWIVDIGITGIRVNANDGLATVTVADLESALSGSVFVSLDVADPNPSATVDMSAMAGQETTIFFESSAASEANRRMLASLMPQGKLRLDGDGVLGSVLLASADELGRVDGRIDDLLNEADPSTAVELLPEYERELDLVAAPSIPERRANIVALTVRRQGFRPADFQQALALLLGQDAGDVVVIERTRAQVIAMGDDREIFRFFIYRDPTLPGTYFLASAQAMVDRMKPSHTAGYVIESTAFKVGDPHSIVGRDILGA